MSRQPKLDLDYILYDNKYWCSHCGFHNHSEYTMYWHVDTFHTDKLRDK